MFRGYNLLAKEWELIRPQLLCLEAGDYSIDAIIGLLTHFKATFSSHRPTSHMYRNVDPSFEQLKVNYGAQIKPLFSKISKYVLEYGDRLEVPLLFSGQDATITLNSQDCLCLLCWMALCLVPPQYPMPDQAALLEARGKLSHFKLHFHSQQRPVNFDINHRIDLSHIFSTCPYKTKCVVEYLKQALANPPKQNVIIRRLVTPKSVTLEDLFKDKRMTQIVIAKDKQSIEDFSQGSKVDFANRYIGGGVLGDGSVQEEIMFANRPLLLSVMLLCEKMADNQALCFVGFRKWACNKGYGSRVQYDGVQKLVPAQKGSIYQQQIIGIDAMNFSRMAPHQQYSQKYIKRQLIKALTGFRLQNNPIRPIISGNWGCGVYGGDLCLKLMIQWIAASLADKPLIFCPFNRGRQINVKVLEAMQSMRVAQVYNALITARNKVENKNKRDSIIEAMGRII